VIRCAVLRELGAVERFGLKVGVKAGCHNVGEDRVSGCIQVLTKGWCGFAAPALTTDRSALKEVVIALLRFVAR
jgi:hypothetical protein